MKVKVILQHPPWTVCAAESRNMPSIISSRDKWKRKAMERGRLNKNLTRQLARSRSSQVESLGREKLLADECDGLREDLRRERLQKPVVSDLTTMIFSVMLVVDARISFRAVPRVLSCTRFQGWIPHFSSTINWVCRVGLASLRYIKSPQESWIALIDMTLDIAYRKALVVLRLPLSVYLKREGSITLADVSCAGIIVRDSWKSEDVAEALQGLLNDEPHLKAIMKDGGYDLARGVRLWKDSAKRKDVVVISDISHEASNALKQDFKDKNSFQNLTRKLKNNATKIYQSRLAFLAPPKLRPKGRFMGISRLGRWLEKIKGLLGGAGLAEKGSLAFELRRLFGGMGELSYIASELCKRSLILAEIMDILKTKGLNQLSFQEAMKKIETLPKRTATRRRIEQWLRRHIQIQCRLGIGQTPLPISTDIIESLFGTFKSFIARNSKAEFNHLILAMPALCGPQSEERIRHQLALVSHRELELWKKSEIGKTGKMKRLDFLSQTGPLTPEQKWDQFKSG